MTITILGTGYVGLTSAAVFAAAGFKTYVIDINPERLASVRQGKSFFYEHGLDPLIADGLKNGRLIPTDSYATAVPKSDIIFSCVGTPDNPDGSTNLTYVFAAAKEAAQHAKENAVFVQKSTVPVGTGKRVIAEFRRAKKQLHYISNPEFLREGTALSDTLWFDRIVVGGSHKAALEAVISIYKTTQAKRDSIASVSGLTAPAEPPHGEYIVTSLNSAELIKVTANAFLALKISFANSIAKLADQADADITEVMDAVGADPRIGRAFLNAGRGYGGGCFPKDISGLIASGSEHGVDLTIMRASVQVNESMPGYIAEKLQRALDGFDNKRVAVLGLSFKNGTSDTRRSPGVALANMVAKRGATVSVYDPEAMHEAESELAATIKHASSLAHAIKNAHAVLIVTDWPQLTSYPVEKYAKLVEKDAVFVDCMNMFVDIASVEAAGLRYLGVGRGVKV
jgi:UDPglucose 6-dehydrogenase